MIIEYHRPQELQQALELLARPSPRTVPMGGGSSLNKPSREPVAVVDLQMLDLASLERRGNFLDLGATLTLQALLDSETCPPALAAAVHHEATYNLRQTATIAGTLVASDGRSPFTTALLALDSRLTLLPGEQELALGDLLPVRAERLAGRLISRVSLPANVKLAYEYAARSPADLPVVCAAAAVWPSGRTRVVLGGFGDAPRLAFDGNETEGIQAAARSAYSLAGDVWASAEYRAEVAAVLAQRCVDQAAS